MSQLPEALLPGGPPEAPQEGAADEHALPPHERRHYGSQWVLLRFDQPVTVPKVSSDRATAAAT